jgi:hypothetical protein
LRWLNSSAISPRRSGNGQLAATTTLWQKAKAEETKMRWHGLRIAMDHSGTGPRVWALLWEASVAGEQVDDGNAIFLAQEDRACITLYFPPSARLLATAVGATRCDKPEARGLKLLAGRRAAWDVHFGEPATMPVPLRRAAAR